MAMYHAQMKILGRQVKQGGKAVKGRCNSSVAAAAYQGGLKLRDERNERTHDYTRKGGVVFTTILLPEGAPEWMARPERLWNAVELKEDESNRHESAQLARHLEFALPVELTPEQNRALALGVGDAFVKRGMVAQVSVHEPEADNGQRNPHAHLLITMREVTPEGFGKKNREWNGGWMAAGVPDGGALKGWRAMIAEHTNDALEAAGHDARVDARSYKDLGIDKVPTVHQGKEATALARKGERTRRGDKQKVAQAVNGSLASANVQRAPEEEGSGSGEHGGREVHEETRRQRNAPEPVALETPDAWELQRDFRRHGQAEREPER
jgi:ATP-dependent exoDNAse (exonuclease V) alpha subunit